MKEEYKEIPAVKILLSCGFSEDYIQKSIDNGDIKIEKSKSEADMSHSEDDEKKNIKNDKEHVKDLEKDEEEDKKDEEDLKKDKKEKKDAMDKKEIEKAISDGFNQFSGNIGEAVASSLAPIFKALNVRLDTNENLMKSLSSQTPSFRSEGISRSAIIEKALEPDAAGKRYLSLTENRDAVRNVIEKAMSSADFSENCVEDVKEYLMVPGSRNIGAGAVKYFDENFNIRFR